jgi:hypothetical protein
LVVERFCICQQSAATKTLQSNPAFVIKLLHEQPYPSTYFTCGMEDSSQRLKMTVPTTKILTTTTTMKVRRQTAFLCNQQIC